MCRSFRVSTLQKFFFKNVLKVFFHLCTSHHYFSRGKNGSVQSVEACLRKICLIYEPTTDFSGWIEKNQKQVPKTLIFQSWTQQFLHLFSQCAILIEFFAEKKINIQTKMFYFQPFSRRLKWKPEDKRSINHFYTVSTTLSSKV